MLDPVLSVGQRIAQARKLGRLTQQQLADRAGYAVSTVRAVEQGRLPASPSFTAAAAQALGLTVPDLYDQPAPRFGAERSHIDDLETAIMEGSAVVANGGEPIGLDGLAAKVAEVQRLQRHSRYRESSALMPDVLRQLHVVVARAPARPSSERAHHLLATVYECAVICLHRLGSSLCGWAAERATTAAELSGDPLLLAAVGADRGLPLMHRGSYSVAQAFADDGLRVIADEPANPQTFAVRGSLYLRSAIVAARRGDRAASDAYLSEARDIARFVPPIDYQHADYYDTAFSTSNVEIHAVAASVEMADSATALTRARDLAFPPGTMRSRLGHHHIDVARAWLLHGDRNRCLESLSTARRIAPQQTRYHPQVHETVRVLASQERRKTESLGNFVGWLGITL